MSLRYYSTAPGVSATFEAINDRNYSLMRAAEASLRFALPNHRMTDYRRICLIALLGLLTPDWYEAEVRACTMSTSEPTH